MRIKLSKKVLGLGAALLGMVFSTTSAFAGPQMVLIGSGGTTVTVADNGIGDANGALGAVTYIGAVDMFIVNVSTGLTKPVLGSADMGVMDLNSVNLSTGAGTLTIIFSDTDFTTASATVFLELLYGGTLNSADGSSIQFSVCLEADNTNIDDMADCDNMVLLSDLETASPFAGSTSGGFASGSPFGMAIIATITHGGSGSTSFDAELKVPEPGILGLFGFGLLGMGVAARRRRKV